MPTYHGIQNNAIYPQPDFQATQNDRGGWTASRTYALTRATWNLTTYRAKFARGVAITELDTEIEPYHAFLTIEAANPSYVEGGIVEVRVEFVGGQVAQYDGAALTTGSETVYRLEGRLSEEPLSRHPKWIALSNDEKFALSELLAGNVKPNHDFTQVGTYELVEGFSWAISFSPLKNGSDADITLGSNAIEFAKRIEAGVTTFKFPSYVWIETTQGTSALTSAQLNKLGKIATPRGNPPEAGGSRNWMLTGAGQEQRGELYQTSLEWELSSQEGYDDFLYE